MSTKRLSNKGEDYSLVDVRAFQSSDSAEEIAAYYKKYQVVLIKGAVSNADGCMDQIRTLYQNASSMIENTFSVESKAGLRGHNEHTSADLFGSHLSPAGEWYSSFISQAESGNGSASHDDVINAAKTFSDELPVKTLEFLKKEKKVKYTSPVWVFVGHNDNKDETALLHGRPEHIDSVNHDGTFHFQSNGSKWWYIRPAETPEWGSQSLQLHEASSSNPAAKKQRGNTTKPKAEFADGLPRLKVVVEQGDILVINTRVWWHQTRIPYTGAEGYSISYAIDFYCKDLRLPGKKALTSSTKSESAQMKTPGSESVPDDDNDSDSEEPDEVAQGYSNVDGLYASRPLKSGEVVFYEEELPDCALPRSEEPNCEIVWLEDGRGALFALQDLQVGDWLTVAPSDSEDSDNDGSDEGSDDDGSGGEGSDGGSGEDDDGSDDECCVEGSDDGESGDGSGEENSDDDSEA